MTVTSLGLALLGALAWTLFDVARKRLTQKVLPTMLTVWLPLAQVPLLCAWAASTGPFVISCASLLPMAFSIVLNVGGLLAFMQAMRLSPMSLKIPLLSFTPVGTTLIGWLLRNQTPTYPQLGGVALVVTGAFTLGMRSGQWPGVRAARGGPDALQASHLSAHGCPHRFRRPYLRPPRAKSWSRREQPTCRCSPPRWWKRSTPPSRNSATNSSTTSNTRHAFPRASDSPPPESTEGARNRRQPGTRVSPRY